MENQDKRPWYKKKRYLIPLVFIGIIFINAVDDSNTQVKSTYNAVTTPTPAINTVSDRLPTNTANSPKPTATQETTNNNNSLSNDNYYKNVDGNTVHSPAYSTNNSVPSGATAKCRDGTYSFSQHRSGTCSHHGGVAQWL